MLFSQNYKKSPCQPNNHIKNRPGIDSADTPPNTQIRHKSSGRGLEKSLARGVYEKGSHADSADTQISRRLIEKGSQIAQITQKPSGRVPIRMASV